MGADKEGAGKSGSRQGRSKSRMGEMREKIASILGMTCRRAIILHTRASGVLSAEADWLLIGVPQPRGRDSYF